MSNDGDVADTIPNIDTPPKSDMPRGRPFKDSPRPRLVWRVTVGFTEQDHAKVEAAAKEAGLNVPSWVRRVVRKAMMPK